MLIIATQSFCRGLISGFSGYCALNKAVANANTACGGCVPDLDCSTASYKTDNENLPSPHLSYQDLMDLFATEFGFNADEVVALLGVHTLGGAETFNYGFKGSWV